MKGDTSLRLSGLYLWAGQLVAIGCVLIVFGIEQDNTKPFWIINGAFTLLCLIVLLITNWKYWSAARRPNPEKNMLQFLIRCNESELSRYIGQIESEYPQEIDLTISSEKGSAKIMAIFNNGLIYDVVGFYNRRRLKLGDILLLKTSSGNTGRFFILDLTYLKEESITGIFVCHVALIK